jgi:hypothetical protein
MRCLSVHYLAMLWPSTLQYNWKWPDKTLIEYISQHYIFNNMVFLSLQCISDDMKEYWKVPDIKNPYFYFTKLASNNKMCIKLNIGYDNKTSEVVWTWWIWNIVHVHKYNINVTKTKVIKVAWTSSIWSTVMVMISSDSQESLEQHGIISWDWSVTLTLVQAAGFTANIKRNYFLNNVPIYTIFLFVLLHMADSLTNLPFFINMELKFFWYLLQQGGGLIRNQTHDLACSTEPQPTMLPCAHLPQTVPSTNHW